MDDWANPAGQLAALPAALPIWRLRGEDGLAHGPLPAPGSMGNRIRFLLRPGAHAMSPVDWEAYIDFVDWLK